MSAFLLAAALAGSSLSAAAEPIGLHPGNPRYFQWRGRPAVLMASGEHYGAVVTPDFDYRKFLATVQAAGLNRTRLFLGDYVEGPGSFASGHDDAESWPDDSDRV